MTNEEIREKNILYIIESALELFYNKGIKETTIVDIAKKAAVTPTTVYRHFGHKDFLILEVAKKFNDNCQQTMHEHINLIAYEQLTGFEQQRYLINFFLKCAMEHPRLLPFIRDLELHVLRIKSSSCQKEKFRDIDSRLYLKLPSNIEIGCIEKGIADGSIRSDLSSIDLYKIILVVLLGIMQKADGLFYSLSKEQAFAHLEYISKYCLEIISTFIRPKGKESM